MSTESSTTESTIATQGAQPPLLRSTQLSAKLAALRLHHLLVESGKGICLSIIVCLELLALLMFVDWWVDFPWGLRLALLLGQFALFNALLYHYAFRYLLRPPSDEDLALRVERSHPELHSRLISSVQFSRADALPRGASVSFAESTIGQTESLTASMDFRSIVPTDSLRNLGLIAFAVLLLMLGSFYASRAVSWDLLRRAFLSQVAVPRKTRIAAITGNFTAGRGDTVRIEATAVGIIPATGQLLMSAKDQRNQEFPMEVSSDNSGRFSRSLDKVQEDFSYQVRLNDSLSPVYQVRVIPRPTVNELECEYHPPAYTGLRSARR
ncbi:MAG: hypothetical protein FJ405_16915, partial [Verrucomicrobia bacterium]|nr:hypothetical protein [Verrucomicrobiota bacterium]